MLAPIRSAPDGVHQMSLRLQPEGLGTVDATVIVHANHVTVQLAAESQLARQAIGSALPQLRHDLGSGGQQATVMLSQGGQGGDRHNPPPTPGRGAPASILDVGAAEMPMTVGAVPSALSERSIDLRL